jgi:hypothetical protein
MQGRSERRDESYSVLYVESLSDARTPLAGFFTALLDRVLERRLRPDGLRKHSAPFEFIDNTASCRVKI